MQRYFEHLLNLVYREYYPKLANIYEKALPFASSYIKFGGFTISLDWYGKTNLSYERLGEIHLITKIFFSTPKTKTTLIFLLGQVNYWWGYFTWERRKVFGNDKKILRINYFCWN
ncbi:MAG: hypothetical protein MRECE_5c030 [Mycoplasmataceae bacterium CE_OT135]|nr:MAG: hypothetical protein MRECE_6c048 [Mycoplasmataceae bacterium CE_OT135]KLL03986.1 MAG: hypothetical protein MRECE_5c030 [Mycoplasmataceae bacterium CE_OT135]